MASLREKYKDTLTDYDRGIRPYFFKHLAKQKGFFNEGAKSYMTYDTSMDYLAVLIDEKEYCKYKPRRRIKFSEMFRFDNYDVSKVKYATVNNLLGKCYEYKKIRDAIWNDTSLETSEIKNVLSRTKDDFYNEIKRIKPNEHTLFKMITLLDEKEHNKIKSILFQSIFFINSDLIKDYLKNIPKINGGDTNYCYYGIEFMA